MDFNDKEKSSSVAAFEKPAGHFENDSIIEPAQREHGPLKRQLKNRHVAMISLAGVIGVGIFVNTVSR